MGVFNLELARQYGYLYQQTKKDFLILHATDGYDEVSLTGTFKFYSNDGEYLLEPHDISFPTLNPQDIFGGETIEESAKIFMNILKGEGTAAQNSVVIANAGLALFTAQRKEGLPNVYCQSKRISGIRTSVEQLLKLIQLNF